MKFPLRNKLSVSFGNLAVKAQMSGDGGGGDSSSCHLAPYIWDPEYLVRCQFYILQDLRGRKRINLYQTEKIQPQ